MRSNIRILVNSNTWLRFLMYTTFLGILDEIRTTKLNITGQDIAKPWPHFFVTVKVIQEFLMHFFVFKMVYFLVHYVFCCFRPADHIFGFKTHLSDHTAAVAILNVEGITITFFFWDCLQVILWLINKCIYYTTLNSWWFCCIWYIYTSLLKSLDIFWLQLHRTLCSA